MNTLACSIRIGWQPPPVPRQRDLRVPAALLCVAGLLLAFGLVVDQAVRQGVAVRKANALVLATTWRCNELMPASRRMSCLWHMRTEQPIDDAGVLALVATAAALPLPPR